MKNFKGFDNWIEIFRGGKQIDSNGREHDGDAIIERAIKKFDSATHEPPLVVGHPQSNDPAFGWVQGLKKSGDRLLAKFRNVVPEFEALAKQGLYKKRSASFYPDGRLRHVGFLGAAPPAVKGLADLKFEEKDAVSFDFYDPGMGTIARIFRSLRDWLIEKEGKETADIIIPDWDVEYIKEESNKTQSEPEPSFSGNQDKNKEETTMEFSKFMELFKFWKTVEGNPDLEMPAFPAKPAPGDDKTSFTESDIEAAKKAAADEERRKVETEFAEKQRTAQREARNQEISTWCEDMVKKGKIAPAWVKSGLPQAMEFMASGYDAIEFGEEKKKMIPFDWFKNFFENDMPKLVEFKEIATRDGDPGDGGDAEKRDQLIADFQEKNKEVSYKDAVLAVSEKHPDLFKNR